MNKTDYFNALVTYAGSHQYRGKPYIGEYLDEVTGGVDQRTLTGLISLVERLKGEGMTLVIIEHNMQVLMSLADDILALHLGRKIALAAPQAIQNDPQVIESYLGGAYA